MKTQYVTDEDGNTIAVILPIKEYKKLIDDLDERKNIKAYDKAKNRKQQFMTAEEAFSEIERKRKKD